jgi:hypothetical protein
MGFWRPEFLMELYPSLGKNTSSAVIITDPFDKLSRIDLDNNNIQQLEPF